MQKDVDELSKKTENAISVVEKTDEHGKVYYEDQDDKKHYRPSFNNPDELKEYQDQVAAIAAYRMLTNKDEFEPKVINKKVVEVGTGEDKTKKIVYTDKDNKELSEEEVKEIELENRRKANTSTMARKVIKNPEGIKDEELKKDIQGELAKLNGEELEDLDISEDDVKTLWSNDDDNDDSDEEDKENKDYDPENDKEENAEDNGGNDEDGKPKEPKRKIRKKSSKRKGYFVYIYKDKDDGKVKKSNKRDWQANVKAWKRYRHRLAKWEQEQQQHTTESLSKFIRNNMILECGTKCTSLADYIKYT